MKFPLTPIMVGLLTAAAPLYPTYSAAAEIGQVIVLDPSGQTQQTLDAGSTITHAATGAALSVTVAGNSVTGDNILINAGGPSAGTSKGVSTASGGVVNLSNSTVNTLGAGQNAHALTTNGVGSLITATNTTLSTVGDYSSGAFAQGGSKITLDGGSITTTGKTGSNGLYADGVGSSITAKSLTINTNGSGVANYTAYAINGGKIELQDATLLGGQLEIKTVDSSISLIDTNISTPNGMGISVDSGQLTMQGGSVTSSDSAVRLHQFSTFNGGTATINDATLTSTGATASTVNFSATGGSATLDNVVINALGAAGTGVWLPSTNTSFAARSFSINAGGIGIDNRSGQVTLNDGSISTTGVNGYGLYGSTTGTVAKIDATNTAIKTSGENAMGAVARLAGTRITLTDSTVDTEGMGAFGLYTIGANVSISAKGTTVTTRGQDAGGIYVANGSSILLDSSKVFATGAGGHGIWSNASTIGATNALQLLNGSAVETTDGVGLLASGGNHNLTLDGTRVLARANGVEDDGIFLRTAQATLSGGAIVETAQVNLDATASTMTGDVLADSGVLDMELKSGSVLTGAVISRTGRVNSLSLDNSSVWNVRGDSNLGTLNNAGTVSFVSPNAHAGFKTLTVNDYVGGGTLVMNTQLGGDASPTDKLVIDGGTTSGVTSMRVLNGGGVGGQTDQGIRLVETINGGTTTTDAFRLDTGSTGFRGSSDTVAINGYDYSLVRGGNQGVQEDWYLTSVYDPTTGGGGGEEQPGTPNPPPAKPDVPNDPVAPPNFVAPPDGAVFKNVSPESGAYVGNQLAASRMFMHSREDRAIARISADGSSDKSGAGVWARIQGNHDSKLSMSEGKVSVDTDRSIIQLGGDVLHGKVGENGSVVAGVMAGYGDARVDSTSRLMLPGSESVDAKARGKVSGYSVGMYATVQQNAATGLGAYADSSLQYGRYSNQLSSELGTARYHSNVWTASVEAGYAVKPFASSSALGEMVVVPQAQVTYSRYDAARASLQGMTISSDTPDAVTTRVGVRVYPLGKSEAVSAVRPFLETNWLHNNGNPGVNMGASTLSASPMRNAAELKLGAEGRIGKSLYLSGQVSGQAGSGDQRGVGGMLNISYRW